MTKVVIDGIEYVPRVEISEISQPEIQTALESLIEIQYFYDCPHKHRAWAWDAMNALSPDLAALASNNLEAAYAWINGEVD